MDAGLGLGLSLAVVVVLGCNGRIGDAPPLDPGGLGGSPTEGTGGGSGPATGTGGGGGTGPVTGTGGGTIVITGDPNAKLCADAGAGLRVGRTRLRRLTRTEFNNTMRDLLGMTGDSSAAISPDEQVGPFYSNATTPITNLLVQQHGETANRLAVSAQARMAQISPCDLTTGGDACARQMITDLGGRAYRRPLETAEVDKFVMVFNVGRTQADVPNGFRLVVEAMLQSPFFLYHADVGPSAPSSTPAQLTSYELASRLSYFLWNTMPDKALFDAAANNGLATTSVLSAQVDRMLADAKAKDAIPSFHAQWLGIGDMDGVDKDTTVYRTFNAEMVRVMKAETANFVDHVIRRGDGLFRTLLTGAFTFPEGPLFALYGVTQPSGFQVGTQVALNPAQRSGILTQGAFLATHAHRDQTSPVHRGLIVRRNMLCQVIPAPPPEVNTSPVPLSAGPTARQRFAGHLALSSCADCHKFMDPIGLAFENYDAIGTYRAQESSVTIDASGSILGPNGANDTFTGAVGLGPLLADSPEANKCMANQWFRFSLGRMESADDACTLTSLHDKFATSGGNVRQLLKDIAMSDAFRYVRLVGAQ